MRITKKYAGSSSIGKQLFQPCDNFEEAQEHIGSIELELEKLERVFLAKIHSKFPSSDKLSMTPESSRRKIALPSSAPRDATDHEDSGSNDSFFAKSHPSEFSNTEKLNVKPIMISTINSSIPFSGKKLFPLSVDNHKSKRTLSAPNLLHLASNISSDANSMVLPPTLVKSNVSGKSKDDQSSLKANQVKKSVGWKRSRSVMALMDFEKLVADDQAAGNSDPFSFLYPISFF